VFHVAFDDDAVRYQRFERILGTAEAATPDSAVSSTFGNGLQRSLFHSTSWHFQKPNRVVLTYFAIVPKSQLKQSLSRVIRVQELPGVAPVDPLKPTPSNLDELRILSHGLSHLAYLLHRDNSPLLKGAIGLQGERVLAQLTPQLAGKLPE
jgi:hypothetical protein